MLSFKSMHVFGRGVAHTGTESLSQWRDFEVRAVLSLRWSIPRSQQR